jgi:hypothetical protein
MGLIKPPSSLRAAGRAAFRRLLKQMRAQGLEPRSRFDELGDFATLVDEQQGLLEAAKDNHSLDARIRLSRQLSIIIGQKSKLFGTIMRPVAGERRPGKKQIAAPRAAAANTGHLATPAPPRLLPGAAPAGERGVLARYLGGGETGESSEDR